METETERGQRWANYFRAHGLAHTNEGKAQERDAQRLARWWGEYQHVEKSTTGEPYPAICVSTPPETQERGNTPESVEVSGEAPFCAVLCDTCDDEACDFPAGDQYDAENYLETLKMVGAMGLIVAVAYVWLVIGGAK